MPAWITPPADLACYSLFHGADDPTTAGLVPGYRQRQFVTRIDGVPLVLTPDGYRPGDLPRIFFGADREVYELVIVELR